jgi:hypothetical protein
MVSVTRNSWMALVMVGLVGSLVGCQDECDDYAEAVCEKACDCGDADFDCRATHGDGTPNFGVSPVDKCESDFDDSCEANATLDVDACLAALDQAYCIAGDPGGVVLPESCRDPDGFYP